MATVIRFARHGSKKRPYFRLVVQDKRAARDGRFIEHIGAYDPVKGATSLVIERARLEYWLSTGAQLSDSARNRLKLKIREWNAGSIETASAPVPPQPKKENATASKEA